MDYRLVPTKASRLAADMYRVQLINFRFMPLAYRVPFQSTCGVFWTLYLSLLNAKWVHVSFTQYRADYCYQGVRGTKSRRQSQAHPRVKPSIPSAFLSWYFGQQASVLASITFVALARLSSSRAYLVHGVNSLLLCPNMYVRGGRHHCL